MSGGGEILAASAARGEGEAPRPPEQPDVAVRRVLLAVAGLAGLVLFGLVIAALLLSWNGIDPWRAQGRSEAALEPRGVLREATELYETAGGLDRPPRLARATDAIAARPDPYAPLSPAEIAAFRARLDGAGEAQP